VPIDAPYFWIPPSATKESTPSPDIAARLLEELSGKLRELTDFSKDTVARELKGASATLGVPHRVTMQVCRAAIVGQEGSPGLAGVCSILGKEQVLERLKLTAIAVR
jgi:glutamyl/glutaminyl-tRNA synthetase